MSSRTILAQAERLWDDRYELRFPFNRQLVESLKDRIPARHREWVPDRKVWIVDPSHAATAIDLLRLFYPDATISNPEHMTPPKQHRFRRSDPHKVLYVDIDAPRCVVDAAFKALCKELHPDLAPPDKRDELHEEMVTLNRAYEALSRDRIAS